LGIENIRNDICYPGLNVRMIGTHSGIAMGFYGTSHHCDEDIGALRATETLSEESLNVRLVHMPGQYSLLGPPTPLYRHDGLDAEGMAATVRRA